MNRTTIEQLLETGEPMSLAAALPILRRCAESLDALGTHQPIAPDHLVLNPDDSDPKIEVASREETSPRENAEYLSPEEVIGSPADIRSSEFSLAVIAYQMLTGHKPFTGANLSALVYQICAATPKRADAWNPELNDTVASVLARALAKEPEQRFESCTAFADALEHAATLPVTERANPGAAAIAAGDAVPLAAAARTEGAQTNVAALTADEQQASVLPELPAARRRRLLDEEPAPSPVAEPPRSRIARIGAFPTALVGVGVALVLVLLLDRHSMPPIPQQTVDPRVGPVAPPPPPDENSDEDETRTSDTSAPKATKPETVPRAVPKAVPTRVTPRQGTPPAAAGSAPRPQTTSRAAVTPPAELGGDAAVELLSEPPDAMVVVDGHSAKSCRAPCTLLLPPGRHVLTAQLDGYAVAQRIFNTPQDSSLMISLTPNVGTLIVTSSLAGATVSVDGQQMGQSPLTLHLRAGRHRVAVVYGNVYREQFVDVQADAIVGATFNVQ